MTTSISSIDEATTALLDLHQSVPGPPPPVNSMSNKRSRPAPASIVEEEGPMRKYHALPSPTGYPLHPLGYAQPDYGHGHPASQQHQTTASGYPFHVQSPPLVPAPSPQPRLPSQFAITSPGSPAYSTPALSTGTLSSVSSQDNFPTPVQQQSASPIIVYHNSSNPHHDLSSSSSASSSSRPHYNAQIQGGRVFIPPPNRQHHHHQHQVPPPSLVIPPYRTKGTPSSSAPSRSRSTEWREQAQEPYTRKGQDLGLTLGDFDMMDTLGTGTFGRVMLARLRMSHSRPDQRQPLYFAMKVLEKSKVVRLRQTEHLNSERQTLASVSHPFIVNLLCTFQDERNLYLLLEYVQGGELFSHLRRSGRFSADVARFYAANLVLALEDLHSKDIIYRDLKPENLLLDSEGYLKITDFGFAKHVTDRTYTLCGTPEYLAPEIIQATGHGKAADFWALGVLIFELLAGYPPFFADNPLEIYEKILTGKFAFPPYIDYVAKDLIKRLLTADLSKRLGNLRGGVEDLKAHRWFEGVDWGLVERKSFRAPIVPPTSSPGDTSNFERYEPTPIDHMPGVYRAEQARRLNVSPDSFPREHDQYGYLFPSF